MQGKKGGPALGTGRALACRRVLGLLAVTLAFSFGNPAIGATCTADDFAAAVDVSGAALRSFNAKALPELRAKLRALKEKRGWSEDTYEQKALDSVRDQKISEYDRTAEDLITKIDTLGRPLDGQPLDCTKLSELNAAGLELLAVMKAKSSYTLAKLDAEMANGAAAENAPKTKQLRKDRTEAPSETTTVAAAAPQTADTTPPPPKPAPKGGAPTWDTETTSRVPPESDTAFLPPPPPQVEDETQRGYTINEIREITRGFFGTISTNLASVIEYAFSKSGRPAAYILGTEGGGAFLAGVRYGKGTLYLRSGGKQEIYWHGPSLGTDFGASGSRTMFLIYDVQRPDQLYRQFTGVDGSAYFVGGVGITFLKGGDVIMAPIRSGLGFRLGANVGYVRFTPRATWNPF